MQRYLIWLRKTHTGELADCTLLDDYVEIPAIPLYANSPEHALDYTRTSNWIDELRKYIAQFEEKGIDLDITPRPATCSDIIQEYGPTEDIEYNMVTPIGLLELPDAEYLTGYNEKPNQPITPPAFGEFMSEEILDDLDHKPLKSQLDNLPISKHTPMSFPELVDSLETIEPEPIPDHSHTTPTPEHTEMEKLVEENIDHRPLDPDHKTPKRGPKHSH
ncbi:MAG: hypothetical protein DWQ31_06660 [Planctomycetota bacterium]|nr:MAG: hypothetical protein DWQ31_06660 [Planctomycetota bacterium]REJ90343.1 MAG: hypothetical protein DWQ35_16845 [Planctomycetota bacterium]